jgi:hypothetical protein
MIPFELLPSPSKRRCRKATDEGILRPLTLPSPKGRGKIEAQTEPHDSERANVSFA